MREVLEWWILIGAIVGLLSVITPPPKEWQPEINHPGAAAFFTLIVIVVLWPAIIIFEIARRVRKRKGD